MRFALFLMLAAVSVQAMENNSVVTIGSVQSTSTIRGLSIDTAAATSVVISLAPLYRQVCVQNLDLVASLACGDNVSVSTLTASNLMGVVVPPAASTTTAASPMCFEVVAGRHFYCRSASVTAPTRAVIIRKR